MKNLAVLVGSLALSANVLAQDNLDNLVDIPKDSHKWCMDRSLGHISLNFEGADFRYQQTENGYAILTRDRKQEKCNILYMTYSEGNPLINSIRYISAESDFEASFQKLEFREEPLPITIFYRGKIKEDLIDSFKKTIINLPQALNELNLQPPTQ